MCYLFLGEKEVDANLEINKKLLKAARILERMVNQNTYNDIAHGKAQFFIKTFISIAD